MKIINQPTVVYDPAMKYDGGRGGLKIYLPQENGVINYNLVHTVVEEKNADIWRLTVANEVDRQGNILRQLTKDRAEWEMAIRLRERPDFIGGFNHGDERGTTLKLTIDGKNYLPEELNEPMIFQKMTFHVSSIGYDPKAQSDAVLEHIKDFCFTQEGIVLNQEIRWLKNVQLDEKFKSSLAMMPPLKHHPENEEIPLTDTFYTDHSEEKSIESLPIALEKTHLFAVRGQKSGLLFEMRAEDYSPLYQNSYQATLSDNGKGHNYHKMYIFFAGGAGELIEQGTQWKAITRYRISFT